MYHFIFGHGHWVHQFFFVGHYVRSLFSFFQRVCTSCGTKFKLETTDGGWHTTFKMNVKT